MITLNKDYLQGFVSTDELERILPSVRLAHENLHKGKGAGSEFTGWLELPSRIPDTATPTRAAPSSKEMRP